MTFKEVNSFIRQIINTVKKDPLKGWKLFFKKWPDLTPDEKRLAGPFLMLHCQVKKDDVQELYTEKFLYITDENICCAAIYNFINDDLNGRPYFGNLLLRKGIKLVDIAVVFKLLFDLKYIDNSIPEISKVVTRLFGLPDKTTIYSNMNDNSKMKKAAKKLKSSIDKSKLIIE